MGQVARQKRLLDASQRYLLEQEFAPRRTFRMGFDAHVKDHRRHLSRETFLAYHTSPTFAEAYDAALQAVRSLPMPPWKPAPSEEQAHAR